MNMPPVKVAPDLSVITVHIHVPQIIVWRIRIGLMLFELAKRVAGHGLKVIVDYGKSA